MNKLIRAYPHPVLRPDSDDFVGVEFSVDCEPSLLHTDKYSLKFTVQNTCLELQNFIDKGMALYAIRIVCNSTMYRNSITFSSKEYVIDIPRTQLLNEVSITPMIISLTDIEHYRCASFNSDYDGLNISVSIGDCLGVARTICFDAQPQKEIGETPESIIKFMKETDPDRPMISIIDGGDYLYIKLHEDMLQKVATLSNRYTMTGDKESLLWSLFVIPTLTQILSKWFSRTWLTESQAEAKGRMWFKVIRDKFETLGIIETDPETGDILFDEADFDNIAENPCQYAELLIGNPLIESLDTLYRMATNIDDSDEL